MNIIDLKNGAILKSTCKMKALKLIFYWSETNQNKTNCVDCTSFTNYHQLLELVPGLLGDLENIECLWSYRLGRQNTRLPYLHKLSLRDFLLWAKESFFY